MLGTRVTWHFFYLFFLVGSPHLNAHIFAIKHKLLQPPKYIMNGPQIPGKITTEQTRYINPESGLLGGSAAPADLDPDMWLHTVQILRDMGERKYFDGLRWSASYPHQKRILEGF